MRQLLISFIILSLTITQNHAHEAAKCGKQLKKAIRQNPDEVAIDKASCPQSYTVLMWLRAQKTASFSTAKAFIDKHPTWPRLSAIQRHLENELYKRSPSASQTIAWFRRMPPISLKGLQAFGQALLAQKQYNDQKFRQAFIDNDITTLDLQKFITAYRPLLNDEILQRKAHALLNNNQLAAAELVLANLPKKFRTILEARLSLIKGASMLNSDLIQDPRLKFEQARLYRKNRFDKKASALLKELTNHENPDLLWTERNLIARRLLEDKKYQAAYDTIKDHGLKRGENFATAEWLGGWLSLRFLKNPEQAKDHFERLNENVSTPVSVARAQYWLGRAHKELGDSAQAQAWWTKAKKHVATYYGQLAHKELTGKTPTVNLKPSTVSLSVRRTLESRELYKYMRLLQEIDEQSTAEVFALKLGEQLQNPEEQALLTEIIHEKSGKHNALKVYKKIMRTEYPLIPAAYPRITIPRHTVEPAFAHAIIRQESRFQPDAVSSAGATGLMQLMPATAALTEQRYKIKKKKLTDPQHNVQIGSHHLKDLMEKYRGSIVLAAAAYNAGASAVDEWIEQFGDPRSPGVNVTDWIELIPYAETRNYVQRVLENYHCYR
ncbi:MAG: lytic transglycosylase domain-containing protein [Candidatus Paracaedibacteraceae bacterium]|nr:lytic transglycosylase domain-containing protein [Candidatus Paracaedibacteraceae bacterium]